MCLDSGARRRKAALPMLCLQDSTDSLSDGECPPIRPPRNCQPEIFTFDVEAVRSPPSRLTTRRGTLGLRSRKPRRVLYPAKVRRYLPPPETDRPLRWFYWLCLLVFVQICCEEVVPDDQMLPSVVVMSDLQQPMSFLLQAEPAVPPANHSLDIQPNDNVLIWFYHQR